MKPKIIIYYFLLFIYSLIFADLTQSVIIQTTKTNFYYIDIIIFLVFVLFFNLFKKYGLRYLIESLSFYVPFFLWIIFEIFLGLFNFGASAIGESRSFLSIFLAIIPFYLFDDKSFNKEKVYLVIKYTIYLGGIAALIIFFIELYIGGRFFLSEINKANFSFLRDNRGIRYLDVYHSFNILLLFAFLIIEVIITKKWNIIKIISIIVLLFISFYVQGRTSLIAIFISIFVYSLFFNKIHNLIRILIFPLIILIIIFYFNYNQLKHYITVLEGAITFLYNPYNDITGTALWRYQVNLAAYEQALNSIWIGQSLGGYYNFYIPGASLEMQNTIPHNLYIIILLKAGVVGVILLIFLLLSILFKLYKQNKNKNNSTNDELYFGILFIAIFAQIPYGFGYTFTNTFGLYTGFALLLLKHNKMNIIE